MTRVHIDCREFPSETARSFAPSYSRSSSKATHALESCLGREIYGGRPVNASVWPTVDDGTHVDRSHEGEAFGKGIAALMKHAT